MRIAIISDVHSNLEALQSTLEAIRREKIDGLWFLGDSVGYGPDPNECIDVLKGNTQIFLAGNHDWAVTGLTDIEYFNPYARVSIEWTRGVISVANRTFLKNLPLFMILKPEEHPDLRMSICLVHSSPREPAEWHYILNTEDIYINFRYFKERICFVGHSHYPFIAEMDVNNTISIYKDSVSFKDGCRYIINVGSVGQPRDGNPYASYAILNKNRLDIKRVSYDILSTQAKMRKAGLPDYLIERLAVGR